VQPVHRPCLCCLQYTSRHARGIFDPNGKLAAVVAGQPNDPDWQLAVRDISTLLKRAGPKCLFQKHRRGKFGTLLQGFLYGGGQTVCKGATLYTDFSKHISEQEPTPISQHTKTNASHMSAVVRSKSMRRLGSFVAGLSQS
jgi:hypothetical protein